MRPLRLKCRVELGVAGFGAASNKKGAWSSRLREIANILVYSEPDPVRAHGVLTIRLRLFYHRPNFTDKGPEASGS